MGRDLQYNRFGPAAANVVVLLRKTIFLSLQREDYILRLREVVEALRVK
jgi:hypothetical protein